MHLLASGAAGATPYLIAFAGSGGGVGAVVALYKLRGDRDSQAVSQAQGAMETMQDLNDALERALKRANELADSYKALLEECVSDRDQLNRRWGPFPADEDR